MFLVVIMSHVVVSITGVGIESAFYTNWTVRGEYTHTGFNKISSSDVDGLAPANAFASTLSPSDNQFMLGLIYHIDM